jgi:hypothetical protein
MIALLILPPFSGGESHRGHEERSENERRNHPHPEVANRRQKEDEFEQQRRDEQYDGGPAASDSGTPRTVA